VSEPKNVRGYGAGSVEAVMSVDEVERQAAAIAEDISMEQLDALVDGDPFVSIEDLHAGYGQMEILHNINFRGGIRQHIRRVGDDDSFSSGGGEVDVVRAHGIVNDSDNILGQLVDKVSVKLFRVTTNYRITLLRQR